MQVAEALLGQQVDKIFSCEDIDFGMENQVK
jgi:hypothetical protein